MLVVEPAREVDTADVAALARQGLAMELPAVGPDDACCMVARDVAAGRIVGFALAQHEVPCDGHILAIAVDRMHRGEGIGKALLSGVSDAMSRRGARHLSLDVRLGNQRAQAFYLRNGFQPEGLHEHAYQDGEDAVRFGRAI